MDDHFDRQVALSSDSAEEVVAIIEGALEAKRGQIDALRFMMGEE